MAMTKLSIQYGLIPTTFEKAHNLGGLWREDGHVWESMTTNLSRYSCAFSDFPWKEGGMFPLGREVLRYLSEYAAHFNLLPYLHFNCCVQKVDRQPSKWVIHYTQAGAPHAQEFDFLVVCSGFFSNPVLPAVAGLPDFPGPVMHCSQYKTNKPFKEKRVLVVGGAYSGAEIASEISQVASKTYVAIRRPQYILPRYVNTKDFQQLPIDLLFYTRKESNLTPEERNKIKHSYFESICGDLSKLHPLLAIDKSQPPFVTINDTFLAAVQQNTIQVCPGLKHFEGNSAVFDDNTKLEVDMVIFATGYQLALPFFDEHILKVVDYHEKDKFQPLILHETVFHPELKGMAFVGMYRGPYFGTIEMQAHWVCSVFSGKTEPPTEQEMRAGLLQERALRDLPEHKRDQFPHGNYVQIMDLIAKKVHLYPTQDLLETLKDLPVIPANYNHSNQARETSLEAIRVYQMCRTPKL
uniref:Flavin-containing monooxygenase n=1 Tax=Arcella intermedia TaxID=1963864 RepID=A0A6B2L360_9EUKA